MTPSTDEFNFSQRIRNKDHDAFNYLYDHYSPALFGEIIRMVKHQQVAEDLLQESFVCIYNHSHDFDPQKGRLFTWMITIVRNKCLDHFRSSGYRYGIRTIEPEDVLMTRQVQPGNGLDVKMVYNHIHSSFPYAKKIFELIYIQGFTHEETAAICGIPLGTVKTRIRRIMQQLRIACNGPAQILE